MSSSSYSLFQIFCSTVPKGREEGLKKTKLNMDLSKFGLVGGSGWGNIHKKNKKNPAFKIHFRPI